MPESFRLKQGDEVRFSCPLCSRDLTSKRDASTAEIRFASPNGSSGTVVFSRVVGHHETCFITKEEVKSYGKHAGTEGINCWGAGPKR